MSLGLVNSAHVCRDDVPAVGESRPGLHLTTNLAGLIRAVGQC